MGDTANCLLRAAEDAVGLFPPDTLDEHDAPISLHRFGAETVLRAVKQAAKELSDGI